jgi:dihydropteroate synthase
MEFVARHFRFTFPRPAMVMGIVNVTPDSFSDGGLFLDPLIAVEHGERLVAEGAEILDIGGESTRPGATPVDEAEELRRVIPVITALAGRVKAPLSIDTQKPAVASAALDAGASIVNDIAANRSDTAMWEIVAASGAGYLAMHMQGTPQTMQGAPAYSDVVTEVSDFFSDRLKRLGGCGVRGEQVVLDPGIGFGKTLAHTLALLRGLDAFRSHERPLLVGVSRKSFIGKLLGADVADRLPGALACTLWAADRGAGIFRTHDVAATVQALRMNEALRTVNP